MELKNLSSNWKKLQKTFKNQESSSARTATNTTTTTTSPGPHKAVAAVAGTKRKRGPLTDERTLRKERKEGIDIGDVNGIAKNTKRRRQQQQQPCLDSSLLQETSLHTQISKPWEEKKKQRRKGMDGNPVRVGNPSDKEVREESNVVADKVSSLSLSRRSSEKSSEITPFQEAKTRSEPENGGLSSTYVLARSSLSLLPSKKLT